MKKQFNINTVVKYLQVEISLNFSAENIFLDYIDGLIYIISTVKYSPGDYVEKMNLYFIKSEDQEKIQIFEITCFDIAKKTWKLITVDELLLKIKKDELIQIKNINDDYLVRFFDNCLYENDKRIQKENSERLIYEKERYWAFCEEFGVFENAIYNKELFENYCEITKEYVKTIVKEELKKKNIVFSERRTASFDYFAKELGYKPDHRRYLNFALVFGQEDYFNSVENDFKKIIVKKTYINNSKTFEVNNGYSRDNEAMGMLELLV